MNTIKREKMGIVDLARELNHTLDHNNELLSWSLARLVAYTAEHMAKPGTDPLDLLDEIKTHLEDFDDF